MFITNKEIFENELNKVYIPYPSKQMLYRVSLVYILKSLILIFALLMIIVYSSTAFIHPFEANNLIAIFLSLLLVIYIFFNLYTILGYGIKVDGEYIKNNNVKISILDIVKLQYMLVRVNGKKYERVLSVVTNSHNEYMFRLNISKPFHFMKQVSVLSNCDIEYID